MVSRALAVISCLALPHGIGAAQPAPWPDIEPVAPPMCSLQPSLAVQPPFAGVPADLPSLASMPALAAMRDCFAQTVQAQAWSLFQSRAEQAPDHRMQVGGIHFLAHEGNISSFPLVDCNV